jgi:hypothetical protein
MRNVRARLIQRAFAAEWPQASARQFHRAARESAPRTRDTASRHRRARRRRVSSLKELGVDVEIQNHPLYDGFAAKLDRLAKRRAGDPHPFVVGRDAYQRFLGVRAACGEAQLARR